MQNALFVATVDPVNRPFRDTFGGKVGLCLPQKNEFFLIDGATFVNDAQNGALAGCFECLVDEEDENEVRCCSLRATMRSKKRSKQAKSSFGSSAL